VTERLYYRDPALLEFEARIVEQGLQDDNHFTVLDRSAFYPTSGGQLHDTGRLNGVEIVDVTETENGDVCHVSRTQVGVSGDIVNGEIDKPRRLRNRQLHTAQHLLSQVFLRVVQAETVSVHLGEEYGAVELDTSELSAEVLSEAERHTNELIADNFPVEILFIESSDVANTPVRKIPDREGLVRVIKIGEFDWSACGGTHCLSTAEVGLVKVTGIEKLRGHVLVKFLAGVQALDDYRLRFDITDSLSRTLTCHPGDLCAKFDKLMSENKELRRHLAQAQKELMPLRVSQLASTAENAEGCRIVCAPLDESEGALVSQFAQGVADQINGIALILCGERLVLAVSADSNLHAGNVVKELASQHGLRGGGNNRVAQVGGAEKGKLNEYKALVLRLAGHA
jgi:alanyl-tRNA synthetase